MTYREAIELKNGLNSPFGKWLRKYLQERSELLKTNGVDMLPNSQAEMTEREQIFGASKAISELVNLIPHEIDELIKQTKETDE